jgi:hypothetical protein
MTNFRRIPLLVAGAVLLAALSLALLSAAAAPPPAGAIVPPKDCDYIRKNGHRYNIKADQLRCTTARRYSASYLSSGHKPSGYACQRPRGSKIAFRCWRGIKTFFAIRR